MMTTERSKRKRGAQPGNTNSFRHGFYSRRFHQLELDDLVNQPNAGLEDEITLLRVTLRRAFEFANDQVQDAETWGRMLATMATAAGRLAYLLRTQKDLTGETDDITDILTRALEGINVQPGQG